MGPLAISAAKHEGLPGLHSSDVDIRGPTNYHSGIPIDRTKLHFGPYRTPSFRYGEKEERLARGEVAIIHRWSL